MSYKTFFQRTEKKKKFALPRICYPFIKFPKFAIFVFCFCVCTTFKIRLYPRYFVVGWGKKRRRERECDEGDEGERKKEMERENTYLPGSLYLIRYKV